MDPATFLAWTFLIWTTVSIVWHLVDKPAKTTFNSNFYVVCAVAVWVVMVVTAVLTVT